MDFQQDLELGYQLLDSDLYRQKKMQVYLVRSDQTHAYVSGNKWFKLKYSLLEAKARGCKRIVSFGGAYSNHIHALAHACACLNIPVTAYIRGQWSDDNPTLKDAQNWGMELITLSREQYREKASDEFLQSVYAKYPQCMVIPEGGSNQMALKGVAELAQTIEKMLPPLNYIITACGTGGTLAGLISGASKTENILGIPVLKGAGFLEKDVEELLKSAKFKPGANWSLDLEGHYGGYAKVKAEHMSAMQALEQQHEVVLEPIYVAKMWRRFNELVANDYFEANVKIALLHSGGLQGRRGFNLGNGA